MKIGIRRKMEDWIMKRSLIFGLIAILGLIGCSRNQEIEIPEANLSLFARTESPAETKTVVESGTHVYWEPGDEIAVFMGEKSAKFTTDITAASGTATFKGTFGKETWPEELDLWAVYPFSEDATFDGETITTTLPSEQIAREGSFGKDMNLSIAHSNSSTLQFYNVGGGIRFSLTEEGIKKVMFEGLSGEIISGKVKIGLEDGLPVVKEVSGGSQFITLLPPSGKETFEKDTWYYIVAIPRTLEGGYKLRFYKDSNYARKVSEKKVEIKRSIFGNLEKADSGIEYEAQTTHFPETEEEWEESDMIAQDVSERVNSLLSMINESGGLYDSIEEIVHQTLQLDNVADVKRIDDSSGISGISIQLRDNSWINYLFDIPGYIDTEEEGAMIAKESDVSNHEIQKSQNTNKVILNRTSPDNNKVLIVAPYHNRGVDGFDIQRGFINVDFDYAKEQLNSIGYTLVPLKNNDISLSYLTGDQLSQYGLIMFATHGGTALNTVSGKVTTTCIDTGIRVKNSDNFDNLLNRADLARVYYYDVNDGHYWLTGSWIWATLSNHVARAFGNAIVIISSCVSYRNSDLAYSFLDRGAAAYYGNYDISALPLGGPLLKSMIHSLCCGLDVERAANYVENDPLFTLSFMYGPSIRKYPFSFHGTLRDDISEAFLVNPYPKDLFRRVENGYVTFSWDQNKTNGNYSFDLYVDDNKLKTTYDKSFKIYTDIRGEHNWYVVANLTLNGQVVASYRTDGEPFTIEAAPLTTNVIYYTSTDAKIVSPTNPDAFGANIVSNEYINGKGALTFDANISSCSSNAFSESGTLSSIIIPKGVTSIGYNAFGACVKLESISLPDDLIIIEAHAFEQCPVLTDVVIPESVTIISNRAFQFCSSLTSLTIPKNVIRIGIDAFIATESLKSISVSPENTTYDSRNNCNAIIETQTNTLIAGCQKTVIPQSVTCIYDSAFYGCKELTDITIPDNVVSIGDKSFGHCYSLTEITLPKSIRSIGLEAFRACPLTKMVVLSVSPPTIGTDILYDSNDCMIYVPASSLQAYKTADGWSNYANRIRAIGSEAPSVSFSPTTCNFGNVNIGESSRIVFTFTNSGDAMLDVTVESCPDDFVTTPKVGNSFSVRANESRTGFSITFYPEKAKYYSGTVVLSTNDPNNPKIYIPVSGTGISAQSSEPLISITPDSYEFGSVAVGQYSRSSITITNTGTADLVVNTIKLVDGNQGFDLGSSAEPGTISPGGSMSFGIRFQPRSKGNASDQILIKSNASNYSYNLVYLSGTGI